MFIINITNILDKYFSDIQFCASEMIKIISKSGEEKELADYIIKKWMILNMMKFPLI